MTKQIKQVATTEEYIVVRYEDDSIGVYNRYGNTKAALREIAKEHGFEYDPNWTTRQFGKKMIDGVGNGAPAIADNDYIVYIDANGTVICGRKTEGSAKGALRMIAEKYSITYEEGWNTQQFGRKVIEHLLRRESNIATLDFIEADYLKKIKEDINDFFKENTKLFYNERDLQMNLANFLRGGNYYDNVFLEYSLPEHIGFVGEEGTLESEADLDSNIRIDIVVEKRGKYIPIELKYKTKSTEEDTIVRFGKLIKAKLLKDQSAQNINRYLFWKDVERIETIKKHFQPNIVAGFCIFLTNEGNYTKTPKGASASFTMETENQRPKKLDWEGEVADSTRSKYPKIVLEKEHTIKRWDTIENEGITFHYCIVEV
jgi:hypothetical protein